MELMHLGWHSRWMPVSCLDERGTVCSGSQQSEVTMQVDCLSSRNSWGQGAWCPQTGCAPLVSENTRRCGAEGQELMPGFPGDVHCSASRESQGDSARASAESVQRIPERILWQGSFKRWARRAPMPSSDSNCPTQGLRCDGDGWSVVVLCHLGRACCRQSWDSGRSCNLEWKSLAVI